MSKQKTESLKNYRPQSRNANKHTQRGLSMLEKSIQEGGFIGAMTSAADGEIFDGSARLETVGHALPVDPIVIESDGTRPIIVKRTDIATADDPKAKRLALMANRTAQVDLEWDAEILKGLEEEIKIDDLFTENEMIDIGIHDVAEVSEDEVPPVPVQAKSVLGDLYELGRHRVLCGDSTNSDDVARLMDGKKAELVFTSPPYGVGIEYGTYDDTIENLRNLLSDAVPLWHSIILDGGFAVINFGDIATAKKIVGTDEPCEYPMALEYWPIFRMSNFVLWSRRVWCKPNPKVHSLQCIGSNRAATDYEHIWTWKKHGNAIVGRVDGISPNGWFDTTKDIGVEVGKEIHGAGMATSAAVRMINCHSAKDGIIHEPFTGTGTTLIAAEQTNRTCYGMELEPKYVDVIVSRYCKFTGNNKIIRNGSEITWEM